MREDMQYISGVLDELEAIVRDASGVPIRKGRAVVDRSDLLVMLDELRGSLPQELAEAEEIRRECGAIEAAAEEEAERIIENAHSRADAMAPETEHCTRAERRANEIIDKAERYAEEVADGSEVYRDRDRKSTRLNSSHANISYAVFCFKKKNSRSPSDLVAHRGHHPRRLQSAHPPPLPDADRTLPGSIGLAHVCTSLTSLYRLRSRTHH